MGFFGVLFVYVLGGITFIPLILALTLLHAYLTFPTVVNEFRPSESPKESLSRPNDDPAAFKSGTDALAEKFQRVHESDVAAGYFAVCREYVPGGVNGKPPERTSPAGEVIVEESPSVYQSMYRSIFDRKEKPTIEPNKGGGKTVKRARNVFYVVLRHGHLMLYDDSEQIEVRHVISLEYHDVSVYGGTDATIPEGELWIKRNAICLTRKRLPGQDIGNTSLPFYLFSENPSEKEDFYFALLKNQENSQGSDESPPPVQQYDVKHIITLVQRLHSSEEQLQTRWINALVGRLFLAMYKTPEMEAFMRKKITKKISRVKKPNFITKIVLQRIDAGEEAPFITNPRLKDLTVNGDCTAEADVKYTGNFRIEIAATARIDLGTRFKPREVELILAVVVKKLDGHGLVRFKPPPSNRIWVTFETMPTIDLDIEPIVSSRQITYNVILRAIESRIREVVTESIVLPFWDDVPFLDTSKQKFRGGIWKESVVPKSTEVPQEAPEDEAEVGQEGQEPGSSFKSKDDRTLSMPALPVSPSQSVKSRKPLKSGVPPMEESTNGSSTSVDKLNRADPPRVMRSKSFATAADPKVTQNSAKAYNERRGSLSQKDAAAIMKELSDKSHTTSPAETPMGSPPNEISAIAEAREKSGNTSSNGSREDLTSKQSHRQSSSASSMQGSDDQHPSTAAPPFVGFSSDSKAPSAPNQPKRTSTLASVASSLTSAEKRQQSLATLGSATAAAKNWWNRNNQKGRPNESGPRPGTPEHPLGRGRPLPPPGIPLPPPDRRKSNPMAVPKRKAVPPPLLPDRPKPEAARPVPKPPLPERRQRQSFGPENNNGTDEVLVVEAPPVSEPTTPAEDHPAGVLELEDESQAVPEVHNGEIVAHVDPAAVEPHAEPSPEGNRSRPTSASPEEHGKTLPSWTASEEEVARSKSVWLENEWSES